ncbi:MAG: leucine-rich repeat protein [Oscillospiraceae bacterium]|nr:leucine-rich repeat protein [Oscillospiraceae bacterium]
MRPLWMRVLSCLLVILTVPAALAWFAFGLPAQYGETFLGGLGVKWDALASAEGRRIVITGGSGVAVGLRCDLLEEALPGYSAVNFGLYAGLGTTVMLELARPLLREGDIVIFSPEQSKQTLSGYFNPEAMWQAADGRPEVLAALPADRWGPMAGQFPLFAGAKARLFRDRAAPAGEGIYARSSFNSYGDIGCPGRERNGMPGGFDPNMPISFDPALPEEAFFEKVNAFAADCEAKGVAVYYRFCPMNGAAVSEEERARLEGYLETLRARLDCEILGHPSTAILEPEWFFDTNFHLNSAGAVVNTAALASELKAVLGDASPVDFALPEMPPLAGTELVSGDNGDGDCFYYERVGDSWRLTGLTEEGAGRERLTAPASRDGVPVAGFTAQVFAGNERIKEIVLQSNIRGIEDGSFAGCTALERLTLENPNPERCPVGTGLLEGTQAMIYVPQDRLSAYCTNYFWAAHAGRIRGDGTEPPPKENPEPDPPVSGPGIRYEGNGGVLKTREGDSISLAVDNAHLRVNTVQGTRYFQRDGHVLTGWNTAPDGSGQSTGLGSRTDRQEGLVLYAQWAEASPEAAFRYELRDNLVWITGYEGPSGDCVVPETLDGHPVGRICAGAFEGLDFDRLVLPSALTVVEEGAFSSCTFGEICLYDALREVSGGSFTDCEGPRTLHVNAASSPVYSGSYFDTFSDKYDWLRSIRDQKKIVLFSGSSGRYGYDSPAIRAAFPGCQVANMGVYAYTNALPQLDLILNLMGEGDILLSAPEFDAVQEQFCVTNRLDASFWAMMESNYDAAAGLDLRNYSGVFDSFGDYLRRRRGMAGRNYGESPAHYDDDGNYYAFSTYNQYGDFILPRPNSERDERLRHNIADYTASSIPPEYVERLNQVYRAFQARGVAVYFTYTPRNRSSLTGASTPAARQALHQHLTELLRVPVISELEDSLYSGVYFYLIDSHLSSEGAALRTERVIADLRNAILQEEQP